MKKGIILSITLLLTVISSEGIAEEGIALAQNRGRVARFVSGVRERGAALVRRIRGRSSTLSKMDTRSDTSSITTASSVSNLSSGSLQSLPDIQSLATSSPSTGTGMGQPATVVTTTSTATTDFNASFSAASSSFQGVAATLATTTTPTSSGQEAAQAITVATTQSTAADTISSGRSTQPTTERVTEGAPPTIDAGDAVWGEREDDDVDLEGILNTAGKLMKIAHLGKNTINSFESFCGKVLSVWKDSRVQAVLSTKDSVTALESFEERMGKEFVGRILGTDGPAKSLLGIIGPEGISEAVRFAIGRVPVPGLRKFADKAGDFVEDQVERVVNADLQYGKTRSIMEAAYISKATATAFYKVYGPILSTLTKDEQNDLIRYAVDTAMFSIDRMILEDPKATITPHMVMRTIGTEFLDLDAKMPRFGMLIRRIKMFLFQSSGLDAYEARALLTSTPLQVGSSFFNPVYNPHDDRSLIVKAFWRGVLYQDAPVIAPERFRGAYRSIDGAYAEQLGIPSHLLPPPIIL